MPRCSRTSATIRSRCSSPSVPCGIERRDLEQQAMRSAAVDRRESSGILVRSVSSIRFAALLAVSRSSGADSEASFCCNAGSTPRSRRRGMLQPPEQPFDSALRDLGAEVIGGDVLEVVGFVYDEPRRGGQHAARRVVAEHRAQLEIAEQQVMVDDQQLRPAASLRAL